MAMVQRSGRWGETRFRRRIKEEEVSRWRMRQEAFPTRRTGNVHMYY
jgi:hypothetical protein